MKLLSKIRSNKRKKIIISKSINYLQSGNLHWIKYANNISSFSKLGIHHSKMSSPTLICSNLKIVHRSKILLLPKICSSLLKKCKCNNWLMWQIISRSNNLWIIIMNSNRVNSNCLLFVILLMCLESKLYLTDNCPKLKKE